MNCKKVRKKLVLFLDGGLSGPDAKAIGAHLECCESCRKEAELLHSTLDLALRRGQENRPPSPPKNFASLFWQREREERAEAARGHRLSGLEKMRWPFRKVFPAKYAIAAVSGTALIAVAVFALSRGGKPVPERPKIVSPGKADGQELVSPARGTLARIEAQLEELEAAVSRLNVPKDREIAFTGSEMREIYAAIGLAAANNYRDILKIDDLAVERYSQVASLYPETSAGRKAQEILGRLN